MGVCRNLQGGFQQYTECINVHVACPGKGSGPCSLRKILDFRPSEIVIDIVWEYTVRIPRAMQTPRLAVEAYTLASVAL